MTKEFHRKRFLREARKITDTLSKNQKIKLHIFKSIKNQENNNAFNENEARLFIDQYLSKLQQEKNNYNFDYYQTIEPSINVQWQKYKESKKPPFNDESAPRARMQKRLFVLQLPNT